MDRSFAPHIADESHADPAVFRALADPLRRQLVELLVAGPASSGHLARRLHLSRVNVSHHLSVLAHAGVVELRHREAAVRPEALVGMRRYFDLALTAAAIARAEATRPVAQATQQ